MSIRDLANNIILEHSPKRSDIVTAKCAICCYYKRRKYSSILRAITKSGRFRCKSCANAEISQDASVRSKIKTTMTKNKSKRSDIFKKLWQNNEYRDKVTKSCKAAASIDSGRSDRTKKLWNNKDYRDRVTNSAIINHVTPVFTDDIRRKLSETTKKNWQDPVLANKYLAGLRKAYDASGAGESSLNRAMSDILGKIGVEYEPEFPLGPYHVDFKCNQLLIEVNGTYWHSLPQNVARDKSKTTYVHRHTNYKLITIWEPEFEDMTSLENKMRRLLLL